MIKDQELNEHPFNFDLARMKERVDGEFIQLPDEINGADDITNWLMNKR